MHEGSLYVTQLRYTATVCSNWKKSKLIREVGQNKVKFIRFDPRFICILCTRNDEFFAYFIFSFHFNCFCDIAALCYE